MNAEELVDLLKAEAIKKHAEFIKEYCEEHKNCKTCPFYGGTCWFNNLPDNWDFISRNL